MSAMRPKVIKSELIEKMRTNREQHERDYLEAAGKYRDAIVSELRARASKIARSADESDPGKIDDINPDVYLPVPERFTDSYDKAIAALEWHQGDQVELDQKEFERWVLNEWEWKRSFAANTQSYVGR